MSIFWSYEEEWAGMRLSVFSDGHDRWIVQCGVLVADRYIAFHTKRDFEDGGNAAHYGRQIIFEAVKNLDN
jgi:hypothetical protein